MLLVAVVDADFPDSALLKFGSPFPFALFSLGSSPIFVPYFPFLFFSLRTRGLRSPAAPSRRWVPPPSFVLFRFAFSRIWAFLLRSLGYRSQSVLCVAFITWIVFAKQTS